MTTDELERHLRGALHETLDSQAGPHPVWTESPAARRANELGQRRSRWPLRLLAVAAALGAVGGAALLIGARNGPADPANGWVAFAVQQDGAAGSDPDLDIWFTAPDQEPRRVVGTATDGVDQACPAFSSDGRSLAYGSVEGYPAGNDSRAAYRSAALVITDVADDGSVRERQRINIGNELPPPCPVWSPDGKQVAFGVPRTSPINPTRPGHDSEVWVLRVPDGHIAVIPAILATDLDWSPDSSTLAIVGGVGPASGQVLTDGLQDARIHLYDTSSGTLRALDETLGTGAMTWSPDGARIAYVSDGLRVIDLESRQQEVLTDAYEANHGIGPIWSPDGKSIAYQRAVGGERHEVVLVDPDDRSDGTGLAHEVVLPVERATADGSTLSMYPWRVAWSPDSAYLVYVAWTFPTAGGEESVVVAVPADPDAPATVLANMDGIAPLDFYDDAVWVPIQVWQRRPAPDR